MVFLSQGPKIVYIYFKMYQKGVNFPFCKFIWKEGTEVTWCQIGGAVSEYIVHTNLYSYTIPEVKMSKKTASR